MVNGPETNGPFPRESAERAGNERSERKDPFWSGLRAV